jgi:hypothetical protein
MDLNSEFESIANDLTNLFRNTIKAKGLIESGRLINSVKWVVIKQGDNYKLSMVSEDYYKYLDKDYNITKDAFNTTEYSRIKERIGTIYTIMIKTDIINAIK